MPHPSWAVLSSDSSYLSAYLWEEKSHKRRKLSSQDEFCGADLAGGKKSIEGVHHNTWKVLGISDLATDRIALERMGLLDAEEEY